MRSPAPTIDNDEAVDAMLSMLTLTDREAYAHAYRVAALSVSIARTLGVPDDDLPPSSTPALLHDIGKLAIPEAILRKPAPLTAEEQALVRCHPTLATELIATGAVPPARGPRSSATRTSAWTDSVIPRGIHAAEASLGARIVCVADAYDTMTRPARVPRRDRPARGPPRGRALQPDRSSTRSSSAPSAACWTRCKAPLVDLPPVPVSSV